MLCLSISQVKYFFREALRDFDSSHPLWLYSIVNLKLRLRSADVRHEINTMVGISVLSIGIPANLVPMFVTFVDSVRIHTSGVKHR